MGKACNIPFLINNVSESSLRSVSIVDVKRCMLRNELIYATIQSLSIYTGSHGRTVRWNPSKPSHGAYISQSV